MKPTTASRRKKLPYREVFPLSGLPTSKQQEIASAVAQDSPPVRWIHLIGAMIPSRAWYEWHWQRGIDPDRRERIPAPIRDAVLKRDGLVCHLCGGGVERADVHLDHVVPYSKGGPTTVSNLKISHSVCNIRKGNRT